MREQLAAQGFDGYGMTPGQFSAFFKLQSDSFAGVVRENGIKFNLFSTGGCLPHPAAADVNVAMARQADIEYDPSNLIVCEVCL